MNLLFFGNYLGTICSFIIYPANICWVTTLWTALVKEVIKALSTLQHYCESSFLPHHGFTWHTTNTQWMGIELTLKRLSLQVVICSLELSALAKASQPEPRQCWGCWRHLTNAWWTNELTVSFWGTHSLLILLLRWRSCIQACTVPHT